MADLKMMSNENIIKKAVLFVPCVVFFFFAFSSCVGILGCKRKEEIPQEHLSSPKKPRLVFTDLQRRTLQAIFKVMFILEI